MASPPIPLRTAAPKPARSPLERLLRERGIEGQRAIELVARTLGVSERQARRMIVDAHPLSESHADALGVVIVGDQGALILRAEQGRGRANPALSPAHRRRALRQARGIAKDHGRHDVAQQISDLLAAESAGD